MAEPGLSQLIDAFDRLAVAGFTMGAEWEAVHNLCQAREGDKPFDWAHALCHRIEGDEWNADYWYRSAGKAKSTGEFAAEWAAMRRVLTSAPQHP